MTEDIRSAWDALAQEHCDQTGITLPNARDNIIGFWLTAGDTRPFFDWVLRGHKPSPENVLLVAAMMARADSPDVLPSKLKDALPFGLSISGKRRGDRSNLEFVVRDYFIGREVERKIAVGEKYEAAIAAVHEWLPATNIKVGPQTVRDAYDTRRQGKSTKR
ncbi:hypothetical protein [Mesorhizobium sp. INR15]|uniref:hypothetical protein n=1 Tax=Mesorhizobium sp. INR15 TaxID=2654248 RepID=UPI00189660C6|nr:hypothetical protein [Mesorhizobium sp. INR15]QPC94744.1 hypothetical protein GA829_31420 [Mesorhizobium sp. INR15]